MMIDVTLAPGFGGDLTGVYTHMNPLVAGAVLRGHSPTRLVFETADHQRFVVTGTDLRVGLAEGAPAILGGTVEALILRDHGRDLVTFADLQTTGAALWQAFTAERDGTDPAALTHLLVRHCWTFHGNALDNRFPETVMAGFGQLDPTGNDRVFLYAGNDEFFTGAANDTIQGGAGNDTLLSGIDDDRVFGGSGADALYGGLGDDLLAGSLGNDGLFGAGGADVLTGGLGRDTLNGGFGDDRLTGGGGADLFVFRQGGGADVVIDFQLGLDRLDIAPGMDVTVEAQDDDTLIRFGEDSVLLVGIAVVDLGFWDLF